MAKLANVTIDGVEYRGNYWITPEGMVDFKGWTVDVAERRQTQMSEYGDKGENE